jgi:hypothetical protein
MQQRSLRLAPLTTLALLLILALQAPPTAAQSKKQEPLLPATAMRTFEAALRTLAKEGRAESSQRLLDALVTLGLSEDRKNKLGQELERLLSKAKPPKSSRKTRALGSLRRALRSLERELADAQGPRREALARVLLLFDKQHAAANEALGHIAIEGVYFDPSVRTLEAERARIHEWMREVRDRKLEIHKSSAEDPLVREVYGREASVARWNNWVLRSAWTQHKAARALGEVVRSWFLMRALQGEGLGEPSALRPWNWVHFHSEGAYNRGIDFAISQGLGDAESAKASRAIGNWFGYRDGEVVHALAESDLEIALLYFKADSLPVPFLAAGQFNWIGLHYLGASMPGIVYSDSGRGKDARTVSTGPDDLERAEMQRMREAGAAGARMYLRWLVSRNEDPPLHTLLEDHIGKVLGDRMLKATFVYEYLQLRGGPKELIRPRAGVLRDLGKKGQREYLEAALGMKLEDFDKQWRAWMMPRSQGLLADLDPTPDPSAGKEGAEVLEELERIRSAAFKKARLRGEVYPLRIDIDLSRGCRLHARYLAKNPEQRGAWPDAHEEYPDQPGFTPEGARAGTSSVIAGGGGGMSGAIRGWMGTFYHRIPLLEPNVVRIGWGLEDGTALLDLSSMCGPRPPAIHICWPHADQSNVPLRFQPELPNPVPGAQQGEFGYPITLMLGPHSTKQIGKDVADVTMQLFEGPASAGKSVDCYGSSPSKPSNPDLAPRFTYCLIPKAHLLPGTLYTVTAKSAVRGLELEWSFRTGR